jgi:hypothetical protein
VKHGAPELDHPLTRVHEVRSRPPKAILLQCTHPVPEKGQLGLEPSTSRRCQGDTPANLEQHHRPVYGPARRSSSRLHWLDCRPAAQVNPCHAAPIRRTSCCHCKVPFPPLFTATELGADRSPLPTTCRLTGYESLPNSGSRLGHRLIHRQPILDTCDATSLNHMAPRPTRATLSGSH